MNKLMRKLSISILAVVFAVVAMGATTFAWFTLTNTAKLDQFTVEVTAGSGFEIAVTNVGGAPSAWKSTITKADVEAAIGNVVLKDLTSTDGATFYPISEIGVDVNGTDDYKLGDAVTDGYAEFDIHFRSKAAGTVKLNMEETNITSTGKTKVADVAFDEAYTGGDSFTATSDVLAYAMNAARMAIIESNTLKVILEKAGATLNTAGTLDNTVGFGTAHAKGALAYYIAKNQIDTTGMDLSGLGTGPNTEKFGDTVYTTKIADIATGPSNEWYTGKITVRIWLEGWDAECLNVIFSDTLEVKIQFEYTES
jgi:hypothetical protein